MNNNNNNNNNNYMEIIHIFINKFIFINDITL